MDFKKITNIVAVISLVMLIIPVVFYFFNITLLVMILPEYVIATAAVTITAIILRLILIVKRSSNSQSGNPTESRNKLIITAKVTALLGSGMLIWIISYFMLSMVYGTKEFPLWINSILKFFNSLIGVYLIIMGLLFTVSIITAVSILVLNVCKQVKGSQRISMKGKHDNEENKQITKNKPESS